MYHVLCPHLNTVLRFLCTHDSESGIKPGKLGAWNSVCDASEMWIRHAHSAVRSALRSMFPMTHACSQVKCANVNCRSSRASALRSRVGAGSVLSMALLVVSVEEPVEGWDEVVECDM